MANDQIPNPEGPAGLLLTRDLIFRSKITGTAASMGHKIVPAGSAATASAILAKWSPVVVLVDLSSGDLVSAESIATYRSIAPPGTPFLAFGSHVDTAALAVASAAGCDPVMPRSRFSNELPSLIRRYFGEG